MILLERSVRSRWPLFTLDARTWRNVVVVTGLLLFCAAVPFVAPPRYLILLLALVIALGGTLLILFRPPLGLIALIITALVVPSPSLPGGLNFAVLMLGFLMGLWLLDMIVRQRKIWLAHSRTVRPLLALVFVACLAFGVGQLQWFPLAQYAPLDTQLGGLAIYILSAGAFLMAAQQINDIRWLARLTWIFLAVSALFFAGWVVPGLGPVTNSLFQHGAISNSMLWVWPISLALSQMLFNDRLSRGGRIVLGLLTLMILYVAFVDNFDWKSGYVPAFAAVVVILALRSWRIAVLLALAAPAAGFFLVTRAIATDEYSYYSRIDAWLVLLQVVKASPILGLGPANYFWYVLQLPLRGYYSKFSSHNQYLDLIAQTGVLGLMCFLWFAAEVGLLGWRLRHQAPAGFARAYVVGVLGGLAGMLVSGMLADWFLPFAYNIGLNGYRGGMLAWIFLGGLVSIERMVNSNTQEQAAHNAYA